MKKGTKKGVIILIIIVLIVVGIVAGIFIFRKSANDEKLSELQETDFYVNLSNEEQKAFDSDFEAFTKSNYYLILNNSDKNLAIEEFIESEQVKHEINNKEPDKDPDSIVIPEDASEEVKQEMLQEKSYWTIVDRVKSIIADKIQSSENMFGSAAQGFIGVENIVDIYKSETGGLLVECDIAYNSQILDITYTRKERALVWLKNANEELSTESLESVVEYLSNQDTNIELRRMLGKAKPVSFTEEQIETIKLYMYYFDLMEGYNVEIDNIVSHYGGTPQQGLPIELYCDGKVETPNGTKNHIVKFEVVFEGDNIKSVSVGDKYVATKTEGFSWQELTQKYS